MIPRVLTKHEECLIVKIAKRFNNYHPNASIQKISENLKICHFNNYELELNKLLKCKRKDFENDVLGICVNMDIRTGKLKKTFKPKHAKQVAVIAL